MSVTQRRDKPPEWTEEEHPAMWLSGIYTSPALGNTMQMSVFKRNKRDPFVNPKSSGIVFIPGTLRHGGKCPNPLENCLLSTSCNRWSEERHSLVPEVAPAMTMGKPTVPDKPLITDLWLLSQEQDRDQCLRRMMENTLVECRAPGRDWLRHVTSVCPSPLYVSVSSSGAGN